MPKIRRAFARFGNWLTRCSWLSEAVKWGNGCWVSSHGPVAYVYSAADHVQFGFFNGSSLKDPRGFLKAGKYVRHAKVRDPSEIDDQAFAARLRQAVGSRATTDDHPAALSASKEPTEAAMRKSLAP